MKAASRGGTGVKRPRQLRPTDRLAARQGEEILWTVSAVTCVTALTTNRQGSVDRPRGWGQPIVTGRGISGLGKQGHLQCRCRQVTMRESTCSQLLSRTEDS